MAGNHRAPARRDLPCRDARFFLVAEHWTSTNASLVTALRSLRVVPGPGACALALAAAAAVGADLVGVDLLPRPDGGWVLLELNGAVDFTSEYSAPGRDAFVDTAASLCATVVEAAERPRVAVAIPSEM